MSKAQTKDNEVNEIQAPVVETPEVETPNVETPIVSVDHGTVDTTIGEIDVPLPVRFVTGMVLSDAEAKVIDAAYRRQFKNNQDAAFTAWQKKRDAAIAKGETPPVNPCSEEALLKAYLAYAPNVGTDQMSSLEKAKYEACLRAWSEIIDEHNALLASGQPGVLGSTIRSMPAGKGAQEARDAMVAQITNSVKQAPRVQKHLELVLAENKAKVKKPSVVAPSVDEIKASGLFD
jgi:hypothetical protein